MFAGSFEAGLNALGAFESGKPSGDPEQYRVQNTLGFTGKYQMGEALLIDLGYYKADTYYGNGTATNQWQGTWTAKAQAFGVNSIEDFRNSPEIQERAIRDAFEFNWDIIVRVLGNSGQTVADYIGNQITVNDQGQQRSVTITPFGILAGAHLRGPYGLANLLLNGQVSRDEYGTSIVRYVDEYAGYDVPATITGGSSVPNPPVNEPNLPNPAVDPLFADVPVESNYNFTDSLTGTNGTANSFSFTWQWGKTTLVENFNPAEDLIDLRQFYFNNHDDYGLGNDGNGDAVIDIFSNNQIIVLDGVSESQLAIGANILINNEI